MFERKIPSTFNKERNVFTLSYRRNKKKVWTVKLPKDRWISSVHHFSFANYYLAHRRGKRRDAGAKEAERWKREIFRDNCEEYTEHERETIWPADGNTELGEPRTKLLWSLSAKSKRFVRRCTCLFQDIATWWRCAIGEIIFRGVRTNDVEVKIQSLTTPASPSLLSSPLCSLLSVCVHKGGGGGCSRVLASGHIYFRAFSSALFFRVIENARFDNVTVSTGFPFFSFSSSLLPLSRSFF